MAAVDFGHRVAFQPMSEAEASRVIGVAKRRDFLFAILGVFVLVLSMGMLTALIVGVEIVWLIGGSALTRFFRDPRANRAINVTFAVLLIGSVAAALSP